VDYDGLSIKSSLPIALYMSAHNHANEFVLAIVPPSCDLRMRGKTPHQVNGKWGQTLFSLIITQF
jgi:hypothetical protein